MMKITGLSHLFKWENLHNWWLTKYFFAPLYVLYCIACMYTHTQLFKCMNIIHQQGCIIFIKLMVKQVFNIIYIYFFVSSKSACGPGPQNQS